MTLDAAEIASTLAARLAPSGFDVFGATNVGAYNRTLAERLHDYRLPALAGDDSLVLVVGNTRRLWPLFLAAYAQREAPGAASGSAQLRTAAHPLDEYSRLHIGGVARALAADAQLEHALRFSFDPAPNTVAIQRLTALAGIAEASPVGLSVHPTHGPWFSLRAAVVFAVPGPAPREAPATCSACQAKPCIPAREKMLEVSGGTFTREAFHAHWRVWLAMRDACPVGREARYSEAQIRYHYLKERALLDDAADTLAGSPNAR